MDKLDHEFILILHPACLNNIDSDYLPKAVLVRPLPSSYGDKRNKDLGAGERFGGEFRKHLEESGRGSQPGSRNKEVAAGATGCCPGASGGRHLGIPFLRDERAGCLPSSSGLSLVGTTLGPWVAARLHSLSQGMERSGRSEEKAVGYVALGEAEGTMGH